MADVTFLYTLTNGTTASATEVQDSLNKLRTAVNDIDEANLSAALALRLDINSAATKRGKSVIPTEESTASGAPTTLTTPDRVSNITVPADGIVEVSFQAEWRSTVTGAGRAALFIGGNQLSTSGNATVPPAQQAVAPAGAGTTYVRLFSYIGGISSDSHTGGVTDTTTGMVLGGAFGGFGPIRVERLAAGTYNFEIRYSVTSGSVFAKNRTLKVKTFDLA